MRYQHQSSSSSVSDVGIDLDLERRPGREVDMESRLRVATSRGRLSTYGSWRFTVPWSHNLSSGLSSKIRRRTVEPALTSSSLSRRPSSRCRAVASQSAGKLFRDADRGAGSGLDRASSSSDGEVDENEGGVGEPASRGKLMLPGMRCSSGTVGDGRTRGMLITLFLRRTRRDCDRLRAVGGLRIGAAPVGGSCGGIGVSMDGCTGGASSMLGVEDWTGDAPAVGDIVARGIDGARRRRR